MKIEWLGHSCFLIESKGYRIVLDPYADGSVPGYEPIRVEADEVLCSHEHADHSGISSVTIRKGAASPFTVKKLPSYHDGSKGAFRGENTIHILDDGEYRIAHLGDLGCRPEPKQMEILKGLDILLIPVGGFYTIGGEQAASLAVQLRPKVCIPMHYRGDSFGYEEIHTANEFLDLRGDIIIRADSVLEYPEHGLKGTVVLKPRYAK